MSRSSLKVSLLLVALFGAGEVLAAPTGYYRCDPKTRSVCGPEGCVAADVAKIAVNLDFELNVISRCQADQCTEFRITPHESGDFTVLTLDGSTGTYLKVYPMADGASLSYTQVMTLGLATTVQFGSCYRARRAP